MKENVIIKSTLFLILFVYASVSWGQNLPHAPFKPQYVPAPDFTLKDIQGKIFRMSAQRGKPVLIFFGTTWCSGCRAEVPKYKKVHETYAPRGLEVIYINIMEPEKKVTRFVQSNALPYRTLLDENGRVGAAYNVVGVPMIILVDENGYVVKVGHSSSEMPLNQLLHNK